MCLQQNHAPHARPMVNGHSNNTQLPALSITVPENQTRPASNTVDAGASSKSLLHQNTYCFSSFLPHIFPSIFSPFRNHNKQESSSAAKA